MSGQNLTNYLWVFTANKPGHAAVASGLSPDGPMCLRCESCCQDIVQRWHLTYDGQPSQRGRVRRCQLINLIRTGLGGDRTQTAKTPPILSDQGCQWWYKSPKRYFWKDIFGWSMPINGSTGSLFVKVFWSAECPRVRAVYLNLPFSWHASSLCDQACPETGQSFTGGLRLFKFSVFTDRISVSWQADWSLGQGLKVTPV